jgi:hypothetical protein
MCEEPRRATSLFETNQEPGALRASYDSRVRTLRLILLAAVPFATVVGVAAPAAHADDGAYINLLFKGEPIPRIPPR